MRRSTPSQVGGGRGAPPPYPGVASRVNGTNNTNGSVTPTNKTSKPFTPSTTTSTPQSGGNQFRKVPTAISPPTTSSSPLSRRLSSEKFVPLTTTNLASSQMQQHRPIHLATTHNSLSRRSMSPASNRSQSPTAAAASQSKARNTTTTAKPWSSPSLRQTTTSGGTNGPPPNRSRTPPTHNSSTKLISRKPAPSTTPRKFGGDADRDPFAKTFSGSMTARKTLFEEDNNKSHHGKVVNKPTEASPPASARHALPGEVTNEQHASPMPPQKHVDTMGSLLDSLDPLAAIPQKSPPRSTNSSPQPPARRGIKAILQGFEPGGNRDSFRKNTKPLDLKSSFKNHTASKLSFSKKNASIVEASTMSERKVSMRDRGQSLIQNTLSTIETCNSDYSSGESEQDDEEKMCLDATLKDNQCPLAFTSRQSFRFQQTKAKGFLGINVTMNLQVTKVAASSCAEKSGVRVGDLIVGTPGTEFKNVDGFVTFLSELVVGDHITLTIKRSGKMMDIPIEVGSQSDVSQQDVDTMSREVFLTKAHRRALESILQDTERFAYNLRKSYEFARGVTLSSSVSSLEATPPLSRPQFRKLVDIFTNGISVSAPLPKDVEEAFDAVDSRNKGSICLQDCATACHICFQSMLTSLILKEQEISSPKGTKANPMTMLGKAK